jgi:apolipoprotein N-acyltransferase
MAQSAHREGTSPREARPRRMGLLLYLLGFLVVASGLAWIATFFGVAQIYVCAGVLMMLAVAAVTAIAGMRSKPREPDLA